LPPNHKNAKFYLSLALHFLLSTKKSWRD